MSGTPGLEAGTPREIPRSPELHHQLARNSVLSLVGRAVSLVGWAVIAPFMLHRLGAERFGLWSLLTVVSGLYLSFDLGLAGAVTKFVAELRTAGDHARLRAVLTTSALLLGSLSLLFVAAIVAFRQPILAAFRIAPDLRPEASQALMAAAVVYALLNLYGLLSAVLVGLHRLDLWNQITMAVTLLQLAGIAVVVAIGGGVPAIFLNTGAMLLVGSFLCWRAIKRLAPDVGFGAARLDASVLRSLTRFSLALQVINLGVLAQLQLDKVLFGSLISLAAVASFELGYRLITALWSLPSLLLPPLLPAVSHLDATGDRARIVRLYNRASRYVLAVAFPIALGTIVLAPFLFTAWLGPGHGDAARAAMALAAMLGVNILTGVGTAVARGIGRPGLEVRYQLLCLVLHVALSLTLIPRLGYAGGLLSLAVSSAVGSLYFVVAFHRFIGQSLTTFARRIVAPPLFASVVGAVLGGLAAWVGAHDPASWTRGQALVRLIPGAGLFVLGFTTALLASRYVSIQELRGLAGLAVGRKAGAISATVD